MTTPSPSPSMPMVADTKASGGRKSNRFFALPRALVSQNKRRYQLDGYDLDLCYLHPRIIVMGFPASGLEALYRNSRSEVQKFLAQHHGERFKVYNFCAETNRRYSPHEFDDRVEFFPIEDHNVPTFHQIVSFCDDAAAWLDADPSHVAVLHCKAGKGRAGMMSCMLLIRMGFVSSAHGAIDWYNRERVYDRRGLTVTSQKKWVSYCEQLLRLGASTPSVLSMSSPQNAITIESLVIRNAPTGVRPPLLRLRISVLDPISTQKLQVFETTGHERFLVHARVEGCVQIEFRRVRYGKYLKKHFRVWFHTMFATPDAKTGAVVFGRDTMDWVSRDRKLRQFPAAYELEMELRASQVG